MWMSSKLLALESEAWVRGVWDDEGGQERGDASLSGGEGDGDLRDWLCAGCGTKTDEVVPEGGNEGCLWVRGGEAVDGVESEWTRLRISRKASDW